MFVLDSLLAPLALIGGAAVPAPVPPDPPAAAAQERERERGRPRGDADWAFRAHRSGQMMSLGEIEQRVIPRMEARGHRYIGSTFDRDSHTYTLKFMRDEAVVWIDVDGRTGRIVGR